MCRRGIALLFVLSFLASTSVALMLWMDRTYRWAATDNHLAEEVALIALLDGAEQRIAMWMAGPGKQAVSVASDSMTGFPIAEDILVAGGRRAEIHIVGYDAYAGIPVSVYDSDRTWAGVLPGALQASAPFRDSSDSGRSDPMHFWLNAPLAADAVRFPHIQVQDAETATYWTSPAAGANGGAWKEEARTGRAVDQPLPAVVLWLSAYNSGMINVNTAPLPIIRKIWVNRKRKDLPELLEARRKGVPYHVQVKSEPGLLGLTSSSDLWYCDVMLHVGERYARWWLVAAGTHEDMKIVQRIQLPIHNLRNY